MKSKPVERKLWRKNRSIFARSLNSAKHTRKYEHVLNVASRNACIRNTNGDIPWYSLSWPSCGRETPPVEIWSTVHMCSSAKRGLSTRTWRKHGKTSWLLRAECQRPRVTDNTDRVRTEGLINTTKDDIYCTELWDCQEWSQTSFHWILQYLRKSQTVIYLRLYEVLELLKGFWYLFRGFSDHLVWFHWFLKSSDHRWLSEKVFI